MIKQLPVYRKKFYFNTQTHSGIPWQRLSIDCTHVTIHSHWHRPVSPILPGLENKQFWPTQLTSTVVDCQGRNTLLILFFNVDQFHKKNIKDKNELQKASKWDVSILNHPFWNIRWATYFTGAAHKKYKWP